MKYLLLILSLMLFLLLPGCGGDTDSGQSSQQDAAGGSGGLTEFEQEHGIGPITEKMTIRDFDLEKAAKGQDMFESICAACHMLETRLVGPPIKGLTERRSPEFLMNMILNPGDMARKHPEGQKMMQEYMMVMPFQNVSESEARAIVEYFRQVDKP